MQNSHSCVWEARSSRPQQCFLACSLTNYAFVEFTTSEIPLASTFLVEDLSVLRLKFTLLLLLLLLLLILVLRDSTQLTFASFHCHYSDPPYQKKKTISNVVIGSSPFRGVQGPGHHIENRIWDWLGGNNLEIMDHHPYSPDLTFTDFHWFRPPLRNNCLVRDLQHTSTWNKLSPIGNRHATPIFSSLE
jgi:hypothetical protein